LVGIGVGVVGLKALKVDHAVQVLQVLQVLQDSHRKDPVEEEDNDNQEADMEEDEDIEMEVDMTDTKVEVDKMWVVDNWQNDVKMVEVVGDHHTDHDKEMEQDKEVHLCTA